MAQLRPSGRSQTTTNGSGGTVKRSACLLAVLAIVMAAQVHGQFFTKSSKSIPRMGRRSLPDYQNAMEAYQQLLADEYNESLLNRIESSSGADYQLANQNTAAASGGAGGGGRLADLIRSRERVFEEDYAPKVSREERSGGAFYANRD
jgi:hypothetical protein